jgi:hypothetical protein
MQQRSMNLPNAGSGTWLCVKLRDPALPILAQL